jgi:cytochrome c553
MEHGLIALRTAPWAAELSDEDISNLAAYVETL